MIENIIIHEINDLDIKSRTLLLHTFFYKIKRQGRAKYINTIANLIKLPLYILSLPVAFIGLVIFIPIFILYGLSKIPKGSSDKLQEILGKLSITIKVVNKVDEHIHHPTRFRFFDNRPIIFYMRSFCADDWKLATSWQIEFNNKRHTNSLEGAIKYVMDSIGPVVCLGIFEPYSHRRFIRIETTDERWKKDAAFLMKKCAYLLMMPEVTRGTDWEVNEILNNRELLNKTIFLNPASVGYLPHLKYSDFLSPKVSYSEDDGDFFMEILSKLSGKCEDCFPPREQILNAFIKSDDLHLICSNEWRGGMIWTRAIRMSILIHRKPRLIRFIEKNNSEPT